MTPRERELIRALARIYSLYREAYGRSQVHKVNALDDIAEQATTTLVAHDINPYDDSVLKEAVHGS